MKCEVCGREIGHDIRCPSYIPDKSPYSCSLCNEPINYGDEYVKNFDGDYAHWECVEVSKEVCKWFGGMIGFMSQEEEL